MKPLEIPKIIQPNLPKTYVPKQTQTKPHGDSSQKTPCAVHLSINEINSTPSCNEKNTGSIKFLVPSTEFSFSIDNGKNYSTQFDFNYLKPALYSLKIKENNTQCESNKLLMEILGSQCHYAIEPDRFIYFEKSLEKFNNQSQVEILIFDKNGVLVFNKYFLTTENIVWKGETNSNNPVPLGNYTYLIKSGNKIANGEITVIR